MRLLTQACMADVGLIYVDSDVRDAYDIHSFCMSDD